MLLFRLFLQSYPLVNMAFTFIKQVICEERDASKPVIITMQALKQHMEGLLAPKNQGIQET